MTVRTFTLDDLTLNEYAILARRIKADPMWALTAPESTCGAEALAGLCWLHDRREQPGVKFEDYLTWRPSQARQHLGHDVDQLRVESTDVDADADELDELEGDDEPTVTQAATAAAHSITGELDDPSQPAR
jgi:hypothetical protein